MSQGERTRLAKESFTIAKRLLWLNYYGYMDRIQIGEQCSLLNVFEPLITDLVWFLLNHPALGHPQQHLNLPQTVSNLCHDTHWGIIAGESCLGYLRKKSVNWSPSLTAMPSEHFRGFHPISQCWCLCVHTCTSIRLRWISAKQSRHCACKGRSPCWRAIFIDS